MTRHCFTAEDRRKSAFALSALGRAVEMRRDAEMALLERLRAELAMPEMYPER